MVLRNGLKRANQDKDQIQDCVDATVLEVTPSIEKRMGYLGLLANISTLMGLLGTIYGLIQSFSAVANADPASKAKLLALGISKAMNTTAIGLIAAISIMVIHSFLTSKADKIYADLEQFSIKLVDLLGTKKNRGAVEAVTPPRTIMAKKMGLRGNLYLIPTTLGDNEPLEVLPISIKRAIENINYFIVENEKTARRFIKKISPRKSQPTLHIELLNKYTEPSSIPAFLNPCEQGEDIGILSEAGCPGIADPGSDVVAIAHEKGIKVIPLVGPSSILLALMASGLNGQSFAFNGYLPIDSKERKSEIKAMEKLSREKDQTQIFIETPYRNDALYAEFLKTLSKNTMLCIASDITLPTEQITTKTVAQWKTTEVSLHKRPSIFIIQA